VTDIEQTSKAFMQTANRLPVLYELTAEFLEVEALLETAEDGEDYRALSERLDELHGTIKQKSDNIVGLARTYEALAEARRNEAKRMADGARAYETRAEWLRKYLLDAMRALEVDRIETSRFTISIRLNPPRVEILEAMMVPSEYQRTKVTIDVDKGEVLRHFKDTGEVVPGVEITRGQRLDIR